MNNIIRKLYNFSPYMIKNIMLSIYYCLNYKDRYGNIYRKYLKFLEKSQYWSKSRIEHYQNKRLRKFLIFSYENTEYYKNIFNETGFNPYKFKDKRELDKLPCLDKDIIRNNYDMILPKSWLKNHDYVNEKTSGTTGSPLQFPKAINAVQREYATKDFISRNFTGRRVNNIKSVYIAGHKVKDINNNTPPFWAYNVLSDTKYFSSYHLEKSNLKYYIRELIRYNPEIIFGYPSSINLLAKYININNISYQIPYVWTGSETLTEDQRENIQDAFRCKINNVYGSTEGIGRAFTCPEGKQHLFQFDNIVSFEENIYMTHFENYAFPLIKYKMNDNLIVSSDQKCSCGRAGVILERMEGRKEDYIITSDGRKIGRLDHIFKNINNIVEAQIYQREIGEAIFRVVPTEKFSKTDKYKLLSNIKEWLGKDFAPEINLEEKIPRTENGKYKFVISEIDRDL